VTFTSVGTSTQVSLRNQIHSFQPKAILSRTWCTFCEENHNENTCEIKKNAREGIFGKRINITMVALDWAQEEDVIMVETQNKSYQNKSKGGHPKTTFARSTSFQQTNPQITRGTQSPEVSTLSYLSKYDTLK